MPAMGWFYFHANFQEIFLLSAVIAGQYHMITASHYIG